MDKSNLPKSNLLVLDDAELVARIRSRGKGWERVFPVLIRRHHADLMQRCRARLSNVHDAEDAVQETVLRAYRALSGFKGESSFRTWLCTIADNQCNTLARQRMRFVLSDHLRELIAMADEGRQTDGSADEETTKQVREILSRLPAPAREVLMLRFFRELSIEEIARTLGIGLSAAKMRLYRALEQFTDRYPEEHGTLAA